MANKIRAFVEWIRKKGREDSTLGALIQLAYHFFGNSYVQAFVSIIGTVVIAIMIGKSYYKIWFKVIVAIYIISTILIAGANQHIRQKINDTKAFQNTLYGLGKALRCMAISLQKCAKQLRKEGNIAKLMAGLWESITPF